MTYLLIVAVHPVEPEHGRAYDYGTFIIPAIRRRMRAGDSREKALEMDWRIADAYLGRLEL